MAGGIGGTWSFYVDVFLPIAFNEVQGTTTINWFEVPSFGTISPAQSTQDGGESVPEPAGIGVFALLSVVAVRGIQTLNRRPADPFDRLTITK